ncbi:MAG: hypothetical protein ABGX04_04375 [Myxococcales bacterium]|nr:hypothetical protein [Myxococcales bacterium]HIM02317.1 hypothetical protein [Myxococcales bacterium]
MSHARILELAGWLIDRAMRWPIGDLEYQLALTEVDFLSSWIIWVCIPPSVLPFFAIDTG